MFDGFSGTFGNGDWGITIGGAGTVYGGYPPYQTYPPYQQFPVYQQPGGNMNQLLMLGLVVLAFVVLSKN